MIESCGGVVKNSRLSGYNDVIKSKKIVFFSYNCGSFYVELKLNDKLFIKSTGGYSNRRDGTYFRLEYETDTLDVLEEIQKVVEKYNFSKNNGLEYEVSGLPAGLGGTLNIIYDSGEKIYHYSNQSPIISNDAENEIYNIFKKLAISNGLDFNSEKSNVKLYDDASLDYLQGKWLGKHFGVEVFVVINGNNIKIYNDNKLTDDCKFIIFDGTIVPNKLKDGVKEASDYHDYKSFNGLSNLRKKNEILITAYYLENAYSTCELLKQKEE